MLVDQPSKPNRKLILSKETVRVLAGSGVSWAAASEHKHDDDSGSSQFHHTQDANCQGSETREPCPSGMTMPPTHHDCGPTPERREEAPHKPKHGGGHEG